MDQGVIITRSKYDLRRWTQRGGTRREQEEVLITNAYSSGTNPNQPGNYQPLQPGNYPQPGSNTGLCQNLQYLAQCSPTGQYHPPDHYKTPGQLSQPEQCPTPGHFKPPELSKTRPDSTTGTLSTTGCITAEQYLPPGAPILVVHPPPNESMIYMDHEIRLPGLSRKDYLDN